MTFSTTTPNAGKPSGFLLTIAGLLIALLQLVACKEADPVETRDGFFQDLQAGRLQQAWERGDFNFQTIQTFTLFQSSAKDAGLTMTGTFNWFDQKEKSGELIYTGTYNSPERPTSLVRVSVVKSGNDWRVHQLECVAAEAGDVPVVASFGIIGAEVSLDQSLERRVPSEAAAQKLVQKNMLLFAQGVQAEDFTDFYENFSTKWKGEVTPDRVKRAFLPFIDVKADLMMTGTVAPIFAEPPRIAPDGQLVISGRYDLPDYRVIFLMRFLYELPKWRLYGVNCRMETYPDRRTLPGGEAAPVRMVESDPSLSGSDTGRAPATGGTATTPPSP